MEEEDDGDDDGDSDDLFDSKNEDEDDDCIILDNTSTSNNNNRSALKAHDGWADKNKWCNDASFFVLAWLWCGGYGKDDDNNIDDIWLVAINVVEVILVVCVCVLLVFHLKNGNDRKYRNNNPAADAEPAAQSWNVGYRACW